jgi:hypothetical protein
MDKITLAARIAEEDGGFLATVDNIPLTGSGSTVEEAQDDLIERFMSWIQTYDAQGSLENMLSDAGYIGADEDTELELEFE